MWEIAVTVFASLWARVIWDSWHGSLDMSRDSKNSLSRITLPVNPRELNHTGESVSLTWGSGYGEMH